MRDKGAFLELARWERMLRDDGGLRHDEFRWLLERMMEAAF